jgi:aminoglycoside phosphotransferase (APT) family kinase protein
MSADAALAARLLEHLRAKLERPDLAFAQPPTPITGGYDTDIFAFRVTGPSGWWTEPLILRRLSARHTPARALRERATQNTLADLGYPAPRVLLASIDPVPIGRPFLVMLRMEGRPLPEERPFHVSRVLVDLQTRLHRLDPEPWLRALDDELRREGDAATTAVGRDVVSFDGYLSQLSRVIARRSLEGLAPLLAWLQARRPRSAAPVICHGDFHPYNILVSKGTVTAVLDWPNAIVADAAFDVATTRVILRLAPLDRTALPAPLRTLVRMARRLLAARYVAGYRRERSLEPSSLRYYEAAAALRWLVRVAEARRLQVTGGSLDPLDTAPFVQGLAAHVTRVSGVPVTLPAGRGVE